MDGWMDGYIVTRIVKPIIQSSIKNRPKIIPGGVLERLGAVLGRLGGLEPSSWRPGAIEEPSQERLGACRRRLGGVLGASWERLRAFGGRPGSLLGRLGASRELLGASLGLLRGFQSRCLSQKA